MSACLACGWPAVAVERWPTTHVISVADAWLDDVVDTRVKGEVGSAIVTRHGRVTGIVTTVGALLALRELLDRPAG